MRILVTGFEPFGGDTINPSTMLAEALANMAPGGASVSHAILPCAFAPLGDALDAAIGAVRPDLVIGFGLATGRAAISLERVAINVIDARIADNRGDQPIDEAIIADGPAAYFSTLPIKAARARMLAAGIPAEISQTAGTFVCNAAFYRARHGAATGGGYRTGFVHLPCLPEMPAALQGAPALAFDAMKHAGHLLIEACLECNSDERIAGGAIA